MFQLYPGKPVSPQTDYLFSAKGKWPAAASLLFYWFNATVLFLLLVSLASCSRAPLEKLQGGTMGTRWHISYVPLADTPEAEQLQESVQHELDRLEQVFSTYKSMSEISQLNSHPVSEVIPVSGDMFQVLEISRNIWKASSGAFDPTVGPLVDLWGFGPTLVEPAVPDTEQLQAVLEQTGFDAIQQAASYQSLSVKKLRPVSLDLSAIAKGYAVDRVAALLASHGLENYLVEVGGELLARGKKANGISWKIAIEKPVTQRGQVQRAVPAKDIAVATSGDYRNFFELDGKRYSHTINPVTGYPVDHQLVSVTVLHSSAVMADGWATAINVLGPEKGLELAAKQGFAVLLLVRDNERESGYREISNRVFDAYLSKVEATD